MKRFGLAVLLALVWQGAPLQAGFINGGFEDNNFNGWTLAGGSTGGVGSYSFVLGDTSRNSIVSGMGQDPFLSTLGVVGGPTNVFSGDHAAKVENQANGARFSQITQTALNYTDPKIFFAFRVVLENPGHSDRDNPHFRITLRDTTNNTTLFDQSSDSNQLAANYPGKTHSAGGNGWFYTDWLVQQLNIPLTSFGHNLELTLLGADCALGGHGGYAVLDGFGASNPAETTPEPATIIAFGVMAFAGAGYVRRRKVAVAA
jgi:hypothetical protein